MARVGRGRRARRRRGRVRPRADRAGLTRIEIRSAKVARPLRIGLLADLQTDAPGAYERRALELLLAERPDLILFAGDCVHEADPVELDRDRATLNAESPQPKGRGSAAARGGGLASSFRHGILTARQDPGPQKLNALFRDVGLRAPLGVYAVRGDVDTRDWWSVFDGIEAELFDATRSVDLPPAGGDAPGVRITGLSYADGRNPGLTLPGAPGFHLVLSHRPDFALGDVDADLLVAGHTHGGQVKFPLMGAPILLSRIPRAWGDGLTALPGGRALFVSRGVGMERGDAPRLRFLCPPEVVVIDVVPASAAPAGAR